MNFNDMFPDEVIGGPGKHGFSAAVLPVGSVEQHGPHLLLGCDGYIALAIAEKTAEKLGGICFPMLPFSWIGGLRSFAGTIDMRSFITGDYMEQVALEIFKQGIDRLVIINCHGGGREMVYSVARRVYKKTRKPVLTYYPSNFFNHWAKEMSEFPTNEASKLAAALYYLGREDLSDKVIRNTDAALKELEENGYERIAMPGLDESFKIGEVGHDYNHEFMHVCPRERINRENGLKTIDFMAEKLAWGLTSAN